ncbi:MAG: PAS domain-containing protein [Marinilabiliales bacterium]|nr:PAS domain-containing protein [Marinilabiliales bacterium]
MQDENAILRTLLDSISDEIWFSDTQGRFTLANKAAQKEFRLDPQQSTGVELLAKNMEVYRPDGSPRPIGEALALHAPFWEKPSETKKKSSGLPPIPNCGIAKSVPPRSGIQTAASSVRYPSSVTSPSTNGRRRPSRPPSGKRDPSPRDPSPGQEQYAGRFEPVESPGGNHHG